MLFSRMLAWTEAEDAGEDAEQGDREHGHGDRGRDGHAHLQHQVERGGPEDDSQHGPHQYGRPGELGQHDVVGDVRLMCGGRGFHAGPRRWGGFWHGNHLDVRMRHCSTFCGKRNGDRLKDGTVILSAAKNLRGLEILALLRMTYQP